MGLERDQRPSAERQEQHSTCSLRHHGMKVLYLVLSGTGAPGRPR